MPDRITTWRARRRRGIAAGLALMLLIAAVVVGTAAALTAAQTPMWTSRTTVVVDVEETGVMRAPAMGTEREIAGSTVVAQVAARAVGGDAEQMLRHLRVTVPVETNVLSFEYDAETAADAQRGAAAFANAYVDYRSNPRFSGPRALAASTAVISPADLPTAPSSPSWLVNLTIAAVLGAALGLAAGYRRLAAARRIRPEDQRLDAPVELLAVLPARRAGGVVSELPRSEQEKQAYHRLCAHVLERGSALPVPSVLVVGARSTVCTSAVAWQLAVDLAQNGVRTVLVAAATDPGSVRRMSGGRSSIGLVGALASPRSTADALLPTAVQGMTVLPPGPGLGTGVLSAQQGLRPVLRRLARQADFVVVDGGAVLGGGTGLEIVGDVPTTLLVAGPDTGTGDVEAAAADLRRRGCRLLGTVVTLPHAQSRRDRRVTERRAVRLDETALRSEPLAAAPTAPATPSSPLNGDRHER